MYSQSRGKSSSCFFKILTQIFEFKITLHFIDCRKNRLLVGCNWLMVAFNHWIIALVPKRFQNSACWKLLPSLFLAFGLANCFSTVCYPLRYILLTDIHTYIFFYLESYTVNSIVFPYYLRVWITTPSYLKVWISHCKRLFQTLLIHNFPHLNARDHTPVSYQ